MKINLGEMLSSRRGWYSGSSRFIVCGSIPLAPFFSYSSLSDFHRLPTRPVGCIHLGCIFLSLIFIVAPELFSLMLLGGRAVLVYYRIGLLLILRRIMRLMRRPPRKAPPPCRVLWSSSSPSLFEQGSLKALRTRVTSFE